ncbi:hypothetical protein P3T37_004677 [Kitasatospora sp. MAA4]|uniref:hypothetical protein n=1 Tax=Kitasatospora sp. MAA4 TaxID=3035093 RepID=UPI002476C0B3|nr:hypothetical protein [Kitasatospora sp. MAA4]MDH6135267.1 hypothetical protein [Kitasatospora sp. MAA4]
MRARHFAAGGVLAVAAVLGAATAAATSASASAGSPVVIQPDAVTPGSQFTVLDGGNCDSSGGVASFTSREHDGEDIPSVQLGSLRGLVGAVATVPESARPGVYQVSVQCKSVTETQTQLTASFTVSPSGTTKPEGGAKPEAGADEGPKGPTHAGLGGSTGPNVPETLAGATLLTTAAAATVLHLRHRRTS